MYAIFETGGKQYKVSAGDTIRVEKLSGEAGAKLKLGNVVAFSDGKALKTGTPYLDATVNATILGTGRGEKIIVFKYKAKKDYRKKRGHRQPYTELEIDGFTVDGKKLGEKPKKVEKAPEEEKPEEETEVKAEIKDEAPAAEKPVKEKKPKIKEQIEEVLAEVEEVVAEAEGMIAEAEEEIKGEAPAAGEPKKEKPVKEKKPKIKEQIEEVLAEVEEVVAEAEEEIKGEAPAEEEKPIKEKKPAKPKKEEAANEKEKPSKADEVKLDSMKTKADIMAELDKRGIEYKKSLKKDELQALLDGGE